jgi:hypothetical protein
MHPRRHGIVAFTLLVSMIVYCDDTVGRQSNTQTKSTATGTAIGTGLNAFLSAAFPAGTALLGLLQSWLTKKLNPAQATEVTKGADTKKAAAPNDPALKQQVQDVQDAAQTLELTSVVLWQTNDAAANASSMLAIVNNTKSTDELPLSQLQKLENDLDGDFTLLKENGALVKAEAATTDIAVRGAFQNLQKATLGPLKTISQNLNPKGDRGILKESLQNVVVATSNFNNLAIVLLGSTGTEITKAINNFNKAGGASQLDELAEKTTGKARALILEPSTK